METATAIDQRSVRVIWERWWRVDDASGTATNYMTMMREADEDEAVPPPYRGPIALVTSEASQMIGVIGRPLMEFPERPDVRPLVELIG